MGSSENKTDSIVSREELQELEPMAPRSTGRRRATMSNTKSDLFYNYPVIAIISVHLI